MYPNILQRCGFKNNTWMSNQDVLLNHSNKYVEILIMKFIYRFNQNI